MIKPILIPKNDSLFYKIYCLPLFEYCFNKISENNCLKLKDLKEFSNNLRDDPKLEYKYRSMIYLFLKHNIIKECGRLGVRKIFKIETPLYETKLYKQITEKTQVKIREINTLNQIIKLSDNNKPITEKILSKKTGIKKTTIKSILRKFKKIGFLVKDYNQETIIYNSEGKEWYRYNFKYVLNRCYHKYLKVWNYEI